MKRLSAALIALFTAVACWAQADSTHVRLTNLPHIYLNTFTGNSITSKTETVYARMWYVDEQDHVSFYDSLLVRVRGNSTAKLAKKPYKLKFHEKVKLLGKGRPNTKKWTLLANHADKTLLRNALTSLMGDFAGMKFTPAAKFADLTLNGQYIGNYQLSDQIDVRPHRVDVAEQDFPLSPSSNITGGYLLEADGFKDFASGTTGFSTTRKVPVRIHYPDEDEIAPRQLAYIQSFVQDFEDRLFSPTFTDTVAGYRPLVDSTSLANWYICTEISANIDGFFSTYFYKEQNDDHIYWGPLWDYDLAYNNDSRTDRGGTSDTQHQLMKDHGYGSPGNGCREWLQQMWNDPWFAQLINRRFQELVEAGLENYLNEKLDSLTALIDASQQLNYQRWGIGTRALRERVLYSSYDRYVADVRTFLHNHIGYLATAFAALQHETPTEQPVAQPAGFEPDPTSYYAIANARSGTYFDVDLHTNEVCCRQRNPQSQTQQWHISLLAGGSLFLVNRATGLALSDPSPAGSAATTNVGTSLAVAPADTTDARQHWSLVDQGDHRYNIVSLWSQHAANLSGGHAADGTPILSYTSDDRNATSANRLWLLEKAGTVTESGITPVHQDYALAYNAATGRLHFAADHLASLSFVVTIFDSQGRPVATFRACDGTSMLPFPQGLYMASWRHDGRQHSVKFLTGLHR